MNRINQEPKAMYLAVELEYRKEYEAAHELRTMQARIADLEAQLHAIGAISVRQSIRPQAQLPAPQQEPVAWRVHPFDYGVGYKGVYAMTMRPEQVERWERKGWKVEPLYAAPQLTENLRCKSTQKRLATLWGYVKEQQPLTNDEIEVLWAKQKTKLFKTHGEDRMDFARAIEQAHNITGDHQ